MPPAAPSGRGWRPDQAGVTQVVICGIATSVWGVFLVTGLDKIFEFCDNVGMGLASVQIEGGEMGE